MVDPPSGLSYFTNMETYSQLGGMRLGSGLFLALNVTVPFVFIRVTGSEIQMRCFWKKWIFPKSSIRRLSKHRGVFSTGLRIEHDVESYTPFIVFWTAEFKHLKNNLEKIGYLVSE